jgi:ATP phosphoribosyltransferase regulatory subunit
MSGIEVSAPGEERWLLPEGIEELLPEQAARVERMRRELLDLYARWGYELVIPPLMEYTESLLIGLGKDLDLQTFTMTDQLSGRLLGIRPDITPQAARIDAHSLRREGPVRLCYAGSVLHTRRRSPFASRSPMQIGAELYGDASLSADLEVISLMLETLGAVGVREVTLDVAHVGIFRALMNEMALGDQQQAVLFDALQHKSAPMIAALLDELALDAPAALLLRRLAGLNGDRRVIEEASALFETVAPSACKPLAEVAEVAQRIAARFPEVSLHFDLCELHGYHYHTGLVFAAYVPGQGEAVANGGRYDDIGRVFGRARPATGFNTDLKTLLALARDVEVAPRSGIYAAHEIGEEGWPEIQRLRAGGERVVVGLPGQSGSDCCDRELRHSDGAWQIHLLG